MITIKDVKRAEANGISYRLLQGRVWRGMDKEQAITMPKYGSENSKWLRIAVKNGIAKNTFHYRVRIGWSRKKAATIPTGTYKPNGRGVDQRIYAVYKGEDMLHMGTMDEIMEVIGVKRSTLQFIKSPFYQKNRNKTGKGLSLVCLDDEEEDDAI